jgi:DNA-binding transcriptional regulator YdaS (Cro superfamily)
VDVQSNEISQINESMEELTQEQQEMIERVTTVIVNCENLQKHTLQNLHKFEVERQS